MSALYSRRQVNIHHPAQVRSAAELEPGVTDVLVCHFMPDVTFRDKRWQALAGFALAERAENESRLQAAKTGWKHRPTHGLWMNYRGIVEWVNKESDDVSIKAVQGREHGSYDISIFDLENPEETLAKLPQTQMEYRTALSSIGVEPIRAQAWKSPEDVGRWESSVTIDLGRLGVERPTLR